MNRRYLRPLPADHALVQRVLRIGRTLRHSVDVVLVCATTDPEAWHPEHASGLTRAPYTAETRAMGLCGGCPVSDFCLVQELREVGSVEDIRGVRAGVREVDRQALYLTLEMEGWL